MIDTREVWISAGGALLTLLLIVVLSGPVLAGPGAPPPGQPLGAESVGQRVRDRARMQAEYDLMREERRLALAETRESVATSISGEDESARNIGGIRMLGDRRDGNDGGPAREVASDGAAGSGGAGNSFRNLMVGAIFLMLGMALYLRFRSRQAEGN